MSIDADGFTAVHKRAMYCNINVRVFGGNHAKRGHDGKLAFVCLTNVPGVHS